jgi:hypothetical protein
MSRAKGIPNKPKVPLSPELAKLAQVAMDPTQDAETQQAAAKALQGALSPALPPPPQQPTAPWPGYMECPCGNLFDDADVCGNCRAYLGRERAKYQAAKRAREEHTPAFDESAFQRELDALTKDLGDLL